MAKTLDEAAVIDAAATLADDHGLDAVTLTRVAKELGITQPALYRHVDGYDGLLRGLGLRGRTILAQRLQAAAMGVSGCDAVRALGHAWRQMVRDHPGLYAATDRYPCAGDAELEAAVDAVVAIIAQALVGFELDAEDEIHAARALRSTFHGFSHLEGGDGHPEALDLDDTFEHILVLLCAGIERLS